MAPTGQAVLPPYKLEFLDTCIGSSILKFGTFTLKSGRKSPYFFNTALFHRTDLDRALSIAYAKTLIDQPIDFDILFGPAYKGIALATGTSRALGDLSPGRFGKISYSFNRKEAKDHGEGGTIVGKPLSGQKIMIIDDVVTAGTAKREAIDLIRAQGGEVVGIIVALDRMEKMPAVAGEDDEDGVPRQSAIGALKQEFNIPIISVLTLDDLVSGLRERERSSEADNCEAYRAKYRASD